MSQTSDRIYEKRIRDRDIFSLNDNVFDGIKFDKYYFGITIIRYRAD